MNNPASKIPLQTSEAGPPVRYIKLGPGGAWVDRSLDQGEIHLGHHQVPHDLALAGDRAAIVKHLIGLGRNLGKASASAREILDFYQLGPDAVWITFARGFLWWARSEAEVLWNDDLDSGGRRFRRTIGGWSNADHQGHLLHQEELGSALTKVASFRQTLCRV